MTFTNLLSAKNRDEFRKWLIENHQSEKECWIVVKRGRPVNNETFWYIDAVEEALCFGWIDSTTKKTESGVAAQRFAPHKKSSLQKFLENTKKRRDVRRMERQRTAYGKKLRKIHENH